MFNKSKTTNIILAATLIFFNTSYANDQVSANDQKQVDELKTLKDNVTEYSKAKSADSIDKISESMKVLSDKIGKMHESVKVEFIDDYEKMVKAYDQFTSAAADKKDEMYDALVKKIQALKSKVDKDK